MYIYDFNFPLGVRFHGADPFGMVGSIASAGISAVSSEANTSSQIAAQREENQKNRDFNTQQAELARKYNTSERLAQQEYNTQSAAQSQTYALQQMREQARLNSPVYQRQQIEQAGLNPQVYFGSHSSFGGTSSASGPQASPASGSGGVSPASYSTGLSPVQFQPFHLDVGNLIKGLAEAKKVGKEAQWIDDDMRAKIRALNAQSSLNEAMKVLSGLDAQIKQAHLPFEMDKAYNEVREAISRIELNEQNKITQQSADAVNKSLKVLNDKLADLKDKEKERLGIEIQFLPKTLQSIINSNTASAAASTATAENQRAQAQTENELREVRKRLTDNQAQEVVKRLTNLDYTNEQIAVRTIREILGLSDAPATQFFNAIRNKDMPDDKRQAIEAFFRAHNLKW